eukprot:GCRY01000090.1.p2 GENE.GCRY01000090.1~~GCRY01000090.1.p2  ORF type:complete len:105 (+),score=36.16 GCRY01000090.1:344-658(+)
MEKKKQEGKAKKAAASGQSIIIFDVKPWEKDTPLKEMEKCVRDIKMEGLEWQASQLADVAFGVKKLVISCKVVDELVSTDELQENIEAIDDYVQSVDIVAFNKV